MWQPEPEAWYSATIKVAAPEFIFATLSNDEDVFISPDCVSNLCQQHKCAFKVGDLVHVRMVRSDHPSSPYAAVDAVLEDNHSELFFEEESAEVRWWDSTKKIGQVERACGCWAFVVDGTAIDFDKDEVVIVSQWKESKNRPGVVAGRIRRWRAEEAKATDDVIRV